MFDRQPRFFVKRKCMVYSIWLWHTLLPTEGQCGLVSPATYPISTWPTTILSGELTCSCILQKSSWCIICWRQRSYSENFLRLQSFSSADASSTQRDRVHTAASQQGWSHVPGSVVISKVTVYVYTNCDTKMTNDWSCDAQLQGTAELTAKLTSWTTGYSWAYSQADKLNRQARQVAAQLTDCIWADSDSSQADMSQPSWQIAAQLTNQSQVKRLLAWQTTAEWTEYNWANML